MYASIRNVDAISGHSQAEVKMDFCGFCYDWRRFAGSAGTDSANDREVERRL